MTTLANSSRVRHPATHRARRAITTLALVLAAPLASAQGAHHLMLEPDKLTWANVPSLPPGAQIAVIEGPMSEAVPFTIRLKLPANYRIPAHWHPGVERVTVLSGTFYLGHGDSLDPAKAQALPAGSIAIMPAQMRHYAWTTGETVLQLHGTGPSTITYVNPADDPRKK